jgi:hypothetical protein
VSLVRLLMNKMLKTKQTYEVTLFQTPRYGQKKGYRQVYRLTVDAADHQEALAMVFKIFNVQDLLPKDYNARFVGTGDILLIDEGWGGQSCYKLCPEGWKKVSRIHIC